LPDPVLIDISMTSIIFYILWTVHHDILRYKDQQDALSLSIYFNNNPLRVSNLFIIRTELTEYAAYGIYHASTLTSCLHDQSGTVYSEHVDNY